MYAKTGVLYVVPRHIAKYGRPLPYFMKYRGQYYANQKLSKSNSNMNRLCYALERWDNQNRWARRKMPFDYSIMIDQDVTYDEETYNQVREVYLEYIREMRDLSKFQAMCRNYDRYKSELEDQITKAQARDFEIDWGVYYEAYKRRCAAICPDQKRLANIVTRLCYEEYPKKDKKFMWIVAENGILENIRQVKHRLPKRVFDGIGETYLGKCYTWVDYEGDDVIAE